MDLNLKIWRQNNPEQKGKMVDYKISNISPDMSFLEMLDVLNNKIDYLNERIVSINDDIYEKL